MLKATIRGLQEAQAKNAEMIGALQPKGALGEAVKYAVTDLHRYEASISHVGRYKQSKRGTYYYSKNGGVGGGAMRAALRMNFADSGNTATGKTFFDPSAVNPLTKHKPVEYSVYENRRGGSHAMQDRTVRERWPTTQRAAIAIVQRGLVGRP